MDLEKEAEKSVSMTEDAQPGMEAQSGTEDAKEAQHQNSKAEKEPMTAQQRHVNAARRRERELAELTEKIRTQEKERFEKELQALLAPRAAAAGQKQAAANAAEKEAEEAPKREPFDAPGAPPLGASTKETRREETAEKAMEEKATEEKTEAAQSGEMQSEAPQRAQAQQGQTEEFEALRREKNALSLAREMDAVRQLNPAIKDLDALCRMEAFPTFYDFVIKNGLTFEQAYRLTFGDKLQREAMRSADNSIRSAEQGLWHLGKTASHGRLQSDVPPEQMALFRELCPELSVGQIRAWYQKNERD